jgi:hypothetical protein
MGLNSHSTNSLKEQGGRRLAALLLLFTSPPEDAPMTTSAPAQTPALHR